MASVASVDAIEFFRDSKRNIRVYYQFSNEDTTIRESCYHQDHGWFVRGDGVVTVRAKKHSPIAATRWTEGQGGLTQIRVFFLDQEDNISQCQGTHETKGQQWAHSTVKSAEETEIAPGSQLAIARPDKDDQLLRLFYQGKKPSDAADTTGGPLREVRYNSIAREWGLQDTIIDDALDATSISAVSHKLSQDVRLYYQGSDLQLRELYCRDFRWSDKSQVIQRPRKLIERAPISAVCWESQQSKLQIRVFTILAANKTIISQMVYRHPDWSSARGPAVSSRVGSGIGSCRDTGSSTTENSPICIFYHSGHQNIDLKCIPADDSPASVQLAHEIRHPIGIPMSLEHAMPDARPTNRPGEQPTTKANVGGVHAQGATRHIAATRFYDPQTKKVFMSVMYQSENNDILETCFDSANGWHTRADQVVVSGDIAMAESPIAVTSWDTGRETRVYYLDSSRNICERVRSTASAATVGSWQAGKNIPATAASTSQLALARTGTGDSNIRLFYQNDEDKIQQIVCKGKSGKWSKATTIGQAYRGTGLAATVTKIPAGGTEIRLYYQDPEGKLSEYFMSPNLHWSQSSISADFDLIPRASISAVSWNADPSPTSLNLQIRILSFDAQGGLIAMSYDQNNDGWDDTPAQVMVKSAKAASGIDGAPSAAVAVQGLDADDTRRMDVFYLPVAMIGQLSSKTMSFENPASFGMGIVILDDAERRRMQLVDGHNAEYWKAAHDALKKVQLVDGHDVQYWKNAHDALKKVQLVDGHDAQYWKNAYNELNKPGTTIAQLNALQDRIRRARSSAASCAAHIQYETLSFITTSNRNETGKLNPVWRRAMLEYLFAAALMNVTFNGDSSTWTTYTATDQKLV